ncbi:MAG: energy transducer TonB [Crocinitomicaceae bacterium]|nr:energy transducer TonB [Crocinitomicaceae bacterium]
MKLLSTLLLFLGLAAVNNANSFFMPQDTMVYDMPEQMPEFPGGADAMDHYFADNIKYPPVAKEKGIQGKVYVQFIVEKDGSVTQVKVRRGAHELLDKEAVRVVKMMPNWKPGSMRGKVVRTRYTVPIIFALS